jgi:hypothetical protein
MNICIPSTLNKPAHVTIHEHTSQLAALLENPKKNEALIGELFQNLGVNPNDKAATQEMATVLLNLKTNKVFSKCVQSGVYLLYNDENILNASPIAVFKVGRKRCSMELACRQLAFLLGLEKHTISGVFHVMTGLDLAAADEATTEALWNGNQKVIHSSKKDEAESYESESSDSESSASKKKVAPEVVPQPQAPLHKVEETAAPVESDDEITFSGSECGTASEEDWDSDGLGSPRATKQEESVVATVGIVQPFLCDRPSVDAYEYALMTIVALAIGLRDGKEDGYKGSTIFDLDDVFPVRVDPLFTNGFMESPATVHLPYLKDERTNTLLSSVEVKAMAQIIEKWDISAIGMHMSELRISYEDKIAEQQSVGTSLKDEGGYDVEIQTSDPHEINESLNTLCLENKKRSIFVNNQNIATMTRLSRIQSFILNCSAKGQLFAVKDLVDAVDPAGKAYRQQLNIHKDALGSPMKLALNRSGEHDMTGKIPPSKVEGKRMGAEGVRRRLFNVSSEECGFSSEKNSEEFSSFFSD